MGVNTMTYSTFVKQHWRKKPGGGRSIVRGHRRLVRKRSQSSQPKRKPQESKQADLSEFAMFDSYNFNEYYAFKELPSEKAEHLMTGWPNINANDKQNDSPAPIEMVAIAKTHNGTLCGYVIPVVSGRDDARITLDGLTIHASKAEAQKIYKRFEKREQTGMIRGVRWYENEAPSEFEEVKPGVWRFWWD